MEQEEYLKMIAEAREHLETFVGKPVEDVQSEVEGVGGWDFRITSVDGKPRILTCDYHVNRVNVRVMDGLVVEAYLG